MITKEYVLEKCKEVHKDKYEYIDIKELKDKYVKHTPAVYDETNSVLKSVNISTYADKGNWTGFSVDDDTQLIIFNSTTSAADQAKGTCLRAQ
jgi:hypothetical protein